MVKATTSAIAGSPTRRCAGFSAVVDHESQSAVPDAAELRAADALMDALEGWAKSLGDAGVTRSDGARYFPSRQLDRTMRAAHREGRLFSALTEWLPTYRGLRTRAGADAYANRMRDIVEHGCPLWETVVAEDDRPWSPYVTREQRQILRGIAADVDDEIARGRRLRDRLVAERRNSASPDS